MTGRSRLDALAVERGLATTRARARALILAGRMQVNDSIQTKAGTAVAFDARIALRAPDHPYVGPGGVKLSRALDRFGIGVQERSALDIGAAAGGVTDAMLQGGATLVVAHDVGRGQLDWKLRADPRVIPLEGINARHLSAAMLPDGFLPVDVVTVDVSFISLRLVLPVIPPLLARDGDVLALELPALAGDWPRTTVVGNIPYNITTPIIFRLLRLPYPRDIVLTVQAEVAARILAGPGTRTYGALSVGVRLHARPARICKVPRSAFRPVPRVNSVVLRITPRSPPRLTPAAAADVRVLTRAAFSWRRKQLGTILTRHADLRVPREIGERVLARCSLAPALRPEQLSPDDFIALAAALQSASYALSPPARGTRAD